MDSQWISLHKGIAICLCTMDFEWIPVNKTHHNGILFTMDLQLMFVSKRVTMFFVYTKETQRNLVCRIVFSYQMGHVFACHCFALLGILCTMDLQWDPL